tara:strand:+ start:5213 stop:6190 length:978 start_codon:yes stop_codon:yes gene_type:complete
MGFLDNSGDIILDAVLTDTGRMRLAKGDGSFVISKFALADDEIDYALYDKNNVSGSAYYDLQILQTPVLEAFTNNIASMKSRLITIGRNDILYLPEIVLNQRVGIGSSMNSANTFIVPVDDKTILALGSVLGSGILNGFRPGTDTSKIRFDQGLNTNQLSSEAPLSSDLVETQYIVQMDNRLGQVFPPPGAAGQADVNAASNVQLASATPSFIDDDSIANYYFTANTTNGFVQNIGAQALDSSISGPKGTQLSMRVGSSLELRTSQYLFTTLGSLGSQTLSNDASADGGSDLAAGTYRFIDSTIRVSGINTGYSIDIPIRFVKSI